MSGSVMTQSWAWLLTLNKPSELAPKAVFCLPKNKTPDVSFARDDPIAMRGSTALVVKVLRQTASRLPQMAAHSRPTVSNWFFRLLLFKKMEIPLLPSEPRSRSPATLFAVWTVHDLMV
jgi:hypothetical protein